MHGTKLFSREILNKSGALKYTVIQQRNSAFQTSEEVTFSGIEQHCNESLPLQHVKLAGSICTYSPLRQCGQIVNHLSL